MVEAVSGERRRGDQAHEGKLFTYSLILCWVLEECANSLNLIKNPKVDSSGSKVHIKTENWMESMENQWSSSG